MLWASDAVGRVASISQDWRDLSRWPGQRQPSLDASEEYLSNVHRDDVPDVKRALNSKLSSISGRFRLRQDQSNEYTWIKFKGWPAMLPGDGSFNGYLGTAEIIPGKQTQRAGSAGQTKASTPTQTSADYRHRLALLFLEARALAQQASDTRLVNIAQFALAVISDRTLKDGGA